MTMPKRALSTLDGGLPVVAIQLTQDDTIKITTNVQNPSIVREIVERALIDHHSVSVRASAPMVTPGFLNRVETLAMHVKTHEFGEALDIANQVLETIDGLGRS